MIGNKCIYTYEIRKKLRGILTTTRYFYTHQVPVQDYLHDKPTPYISTCEIHVSVQQTIFFFSRVLYIGKYSGLTVYSQQYDFVQFIHRKRKCKRN
jgi:hypothetical protein